MKVIILAAGYGTRLYPLTSDLPKPLIPINNKPIINFIIEKINNLRGQFLVEEIKIVSNNKFYKNFLDWKRKYNIEAKILNDGSNNPKDKKGAIKDIKFAMKSEASDWLVLGGDNLFEDDLSEFIKFSLGLRPSPCVCIYDVKDRKTATNFGVVKCDSSRKIIELKEKPASPESTLVATCIYFFPKETLHFLNSYLKTDRHLDASGKYIEWLIAKIDVYGYALKSDWLDIGHKENLHCAEGRFK